MRKEITLREHSKQTVVVGDDLNVSQENVGADQRLLAEAVRRVVVAEPGFVIAINATTEKVTSLGIIALS